MRDPRPLACVMGDMDLLRPLGLARIPCVVVARPGAAPRFSRFARAALPWVDTWEHADEQVDTLMRFASRQSQPPVLFYQEDRDLLLVSRHRERLRSAFRFPIGDATVVEDLVDKGRFQALARRLNLPVPVPVARQLPHPAPDRGGVRRALPDRDQAAHPPHGPLGPAGRPGQGHAGREPRGAAATVAARRDGKCARARSAARARPGNGR